MLLLFSLPSIMQSWTFLQERLAAPYPNDGLEGTLLYEARLVWAGEALYRPLTRYEFVSAPYPPLYTATIALFDHIPGPSIFWGARLVGVLSALGLCIVIVLLVHSVERDWLGGLSAAVLFFIAPVVTLWATRIKPDMMAIFLATIGLLAVILSEDIGKRGNIETGEQERGRIGWLVIAAIFFSMAFFTRQTTGMAALASGLGLLLNDIIAYRQETTTAFMRQRPLPLGQRSMAFGLLMAAFCLGGWWFADLITAGQYSAHVWGLHRSEWWSLYLVQKYTRQLYPYWPILPLLIPLLLQMRHNPRARLLGCYVLLAPITLLGAAEISANHNHMLETILALSLALGMALAWAVAQMREQSSNQRHHHLNMLSTVLVITVAYGQLWLASREHPFFKGELSPPDPPTRFIEFIANTPGEILADDVGLLLAGGKAVRYNDPSTMGPAARWGIWDQSGLLEEIAAKKFSAIMLRDDVEKHPYDDVGRWTREMRQAINTYYQIKFRDKIRVYVPR